MGSVPLDKRANRSWLDGLHVVLRMPLAVVHLTLDPRMTPLMAHYHSWVTRRNKYRQKYISASILTL